MRVSTRIGLELPSRSNCRSSSTRSSLTWAFERQVADLVEEDRAERSASSKSPDLSSDAPVNAPFSRPNNSLSSRVSGIAAQLTRTRGLARRALSSWMYDASSSLPVPVSPRISTVASVTATWLASATTL